MDMKLICKAPVTKAGHKPLSYHVQYSSLNKIGSKAPANGVGLD